MTLEQALILATFIEQGHKIKNDAHWVAQLSNFHSCTFAGVDFKKYETSKRAEYIMAIEAHTDQGDIVFRMYFYDNVSDYDLLNRIIDTLSNLIKGCKKIYTNESETE